MSTDDELLITGPCIIQFQTSVSTPLTDAMHQICSETSPIAPHDNECVLMCWALDSLMLLPQSLPAGSST